MKWWQRVLFSVISLAAGFFSLDFLYNAFIRLTNSYGPASARSQNVPASPQQLVGGLMFIGWLVLFGFYCILIIKLSPGADIIEHDPESGREKKHFKWLDLIVQVVLILTGMTARWVVLSVFVLRV